MSNGRPLPPRCASPSPRSRNEPRSIRPASRASPVVDTMAARRALRYPSSSSGWRPKSASEMARLTTASPRNSSRSLCPGASPGCSWCQLEWTRACPSRPRSRTGRPICAANASAARTRPLPTDRAAGSLGRVLVDVVDSVLDGADLLRILVRDLRPELLFEAHDELDEIERVGIQVVDERRLGLDLFLVGAELLDHDLLEAVVGCCHLLLLELGCYRRWLGPLGSAVILPRTPFMRRRIGSPLYVRANSTHSAIATRAGVAEC